MNHGHLAWTLSFLNMTAMVSAQHQQKDFCLTSNTFLIHHWFLPRVLHERNSIYYLMAPDFNIAAPPSNIFSPRPRAISRPSCHGEEVPVIHVGTAAFSQPQRQLDRLRLCLAQRSRRFKKTDIYLAAVLSYETMQGIVGYCFYMALWGTFTAGLWVGLLIVKVTLT